MWGWSRCAASAEAAQQVICRDIRGEAMCEVPYYPFAHYLQPTAYRSNLTGLLEGFATFWSVRRGCCSVCPQAPGARRLRAWLAA